MGTRYRIPTRSQDMVLVLSDVRHLVSLSDLSFMAATDKIKAFLQVESPLLAL